MMRRPCTVSSKRRRASYQDRPPGSGVPVAGMSEACSGQRQPLQATALYCGLNWLPPFAMHCTFVCDDETLQAQARHYKQRLLEWQEAHHG